MQTTLYLKYRPQRIEDLDLTEVKNGFEKILRNLDSGAGAKSLPHAWLFSGSRGLGKTSSARILAKILNCEKRKGIDPCNSCEMCAEITAGSAVDVVEIDAASNRGIDEMRELRERIKLAPMRAKYKVYIIDEVHMLTTEAANALLKTLEEPPENTFFFLCTTEAERLPETVVSRCTRVTFRKPTVDEAVSSLKRVVKGEKIEATDEALKTIALAAKGSFRDGTKILEQVILSSDKVNKEVVESVIGERGQTDVREWLKLVIEGKQMEALAGVAEMEQRGINLRRFVELVIEDLRDRLLQEVKLSGKNKSKWVKWISDLDMAYFQMKDSAVPQLPLEVWVIQRAGSEEVIVEKKEGGERVSEELKAAPEKKVLERIEIKQDSVKEEVAVEGVGSGKGKFKLDDLVSKWSEVMQTVRPKNHSVEALLRSTKPVSFDGEKLELEVFYKFHKDKLETERCRRIVETSVAETFSVSGIKLYLKLGQSKTKTKEEVSAEGVGPDIVKAAEEIFGTGVV